MTRDHNTERCDVERGLTPFYSRRTRGCESLSARAAVAAIISCLALATGCRSLFLHDEQVARFEPEQGRYINGSDATRDWSQARDDAYNERAPRRESEYARAIAQSTTRGAAPRYSEEVNSDAFASSAATPSWSQRIKNVFTPPSLGFSSSNEPGLDDDLVRSNPYNNRALPSPAVTQRNRGRAVDATSDVYQAEQKKPSFWSKLFGGGEGEKVDAKEYPGARQNYSEQANNALSRQTVARAERVAADAQPSKTNSSIASLKNVFGKKRPVRVEPWNDPAAPISQFSQYNYMPHKTLIELYYSHGDMTPSRPESQRRYGVEQASLDYYGRLERAASNKRAYRSRSYAPSRNSEEDLPISPRGRVQDDEYDYEEELDEEYEREGARRLGAASLSPIPQSTNRIAQATSRSNQLGVTRPAQAVAQIPKRAVTKIAQTAYEQATSNAQADEGEEYASADPDSLFGWSAETSNAVDAFPTSRRSARVARPASATLPTTDVDASFKNKLGARDSFEWFEQNAQEDNQQPLDAKLYEREQPLTSLNVSLIPQALEEKTLEPDEALDALISDQAKDGVESEVPTAEFPSVLPELGASNAVVDSSSNESGASTENEQTVVEQSYEDELDGIIDQAISDPIYASNSDPDPTNVAADTQDGTLGALENLLAAPSPNKEANESTSDAKVSDLATAISESVAASGVAPSALASSDPNEELRQKATELNATTQHAPESVDARKGDAVAAPLTPEEIAWVEQVKSAIQALLREREEHKRQGDDVRICDARLRLLFLVIGEYERSIQEIQDDSDPLKTFWEKECRGLETLLQNQLEEIDPTFVAERLRSGLDSFSGLCKLQIRKALLVASPACYGLFEERITPYRRHETVYAYAELDYVTSAETDRGYEINVECRWRLLDKNGVEIIPFETQRCVNLSETKLRDVVLNVSVPLPSTLSSGVYHLELDVVDLNASNPTSSVKRLTLTVADTESEGAYR